MDTQRDNLVGLLAVDKPYKYINESWWIHQSKLARIKSINLRVDAIRL